VPIAHQAGRISDSIIGVNRENVAGHQIASAQVIDGVAGPPVFSLTLTSLGIIFIPATSSLGLFIAEPRMRFIFRAFEEPAPPFVSAPLNTGFIIYIVVTRHFLLPSFLCFYS